MRRSQVRSTDDCRFDETYRLILRRQCRAVPIPDTIATLRCQLLSVLLRGKYGNLGNWSVSRSQQRSSARGAESELIETTTRTPAASAVSATRGVADDIKRVRRDSGPVVCCESVRAASSSARRPRAPPGTQGARAARIIARRQRPARTDRARPARHNSTLPSSGRSTTSRGAPRSPPTSTTPLPLPSARIALRTRPTTFISFVWKYRKNDQHGATVSAPPPPPVPVRVPCAAPPGRLRSARRAHTTPAPPFLRHTDPWSFGNPSTRLGNPPRRYTYSLLG